MTPQELLAAMGRGEDSEVAHVTPGEMVIPREVGQDPKLIGAFAKAMQDRGMNFLDFVVGPGSPRNPNSGLMEFVAPGTVGGGPSARAARSAPSSTPGGGTRSAQESQKKRTVQRQRGFFSGKPATASSVAQNLGVTPALAFGTAQLGGDLAASMGLKGLTGNDPIGRGVSRGGGRDVRDGVPQRIISAITGPRTFTRPLALSAPSSFGFNGQSSLQQRAAIATGALNADDPVFRSEEAFNYFRNLLQRDLIDDQGGLADFSTVLPIESQFLAQSRGLQFGQDTQSLLEAIA
ncbi:MAG: hypothetical protein J3T61_00245 [Candidatus Brocadiales bacterium]|nr:hypothetical protein [Candidatus Bathyanammoxibius sp.]